MNSQNQDKLPRSQNQLIYDTCSYQKRLLQSTSPLNYHFYEGKFENCKKHNCVEKKIYNKLDLVDVESELWNIERPLSDCGQFKYSKDGKNSKITSDKAPVYLSADLCPIVNRDESRPEVKSSGLPTLYNDVKNDDLISSEGLYYEDYAKSR